MKNMKKLLLLSFLFSAPAFCMNNSNKLSAIALQKEHTSTSFQLKGWVIDAEKPKKNKNIKNTDQENNQFKYTCPNCPQELNGKTFKALKDTLRAHHFRCRALKIDDLVILSNNGKTITCNKCNQIFRGKQPQESRLLFRKHKCPKNNNLEIFCSEWESSLHTFLKDFGRSTEKYSFKVPRKTTLPHKMLYGQYPPTLPYPSSDLAITSQTINSSSSDKLAFIKPAPVKPITKINIQQISQNQRPIIMPTISNLINHDTEELKNLTKK